LAALIAAQCRHSHLTLSLAPIHEPKPPDSGHWTPDWTRVYLAGPAVPSAVMRLRL
jgi:hypothetical protein